MQQSPAPPTPEPLHHQHHHQHRRHQEVVHHQELHHHHQRYQDRRHQEVVHHQELHHHHQRYQDRRHQEVVHHQELHHHQLWIQQMAAEAANQTGGEGGGAVNQSAMVMIPQSTMEMIMSQLQDAMTAIDSGNKDNATKALKSVDQELKSAANASGIPIETTTG